MVECFFLLLVLEAFLKWKKVPIQDLDKVDQYIKAVMFKVFATFPRTEGTGHNNAKSHFCVHFVSDITRAGSGSNYDSGPGESNHKKNIKEPGRNTQKRVGSFPLQCSRQYINMLIVQRAWKDHPRWTPTSNKEEEDDDACACAGSSVPTEHEQERKDCFFGVYLTIRTHEAYYGLGSEGSTKRRNRRKIGRYPQWADSDICFQTLIDLVRNKILDKMAGNLLPKTNTKLEVRVFTRTVRNGVAYHANPSHGRHNMAKQHWAEFAFGDDGEKTTLYPCHMLCFLEISVDPTDTIYFDCGTMVDKKGFYAIVHRGVSPITNKTPHIDQIPDGDEYWPGWEYGTLAEPNQRIVHCMAKKIVTGENRLAVLALNCNSIRKPMVAVRDPKDERGALSNLYYFLLGQSDWGQCFHNMAMKQGGVNRKQATRRTSRNSDSTEKMIDDDSMRGGAPDTNVGDENWDNDFEDVEVMEDYSVGTDEDQHGIEEEDSEDED
jgi:hypothetical protein